MDVFPWTETVMIRTDSLGDTPATMQIRSMTAEVRKSIADKPSSI